MPKGIPLTEEEQQRRRKQIFDASVHLFLEKGFNETSMREIAKAAGMGKSTLYDYYQTKDDILVSYFEHEIDKITTQAEQIIQGNSTYSEKLRKIMQAHLNFLMDSKQTFLKLTLEAQRLSQESQEHIQTHRHAYQDMLRSLIEEGIRQGEFRPVNPLFAARSIFSLLSISVFTTRPTGTPDEMLDQALGILLQGIQA
jgi:AcrR family transcriptional regulator